MMVWVFAANVAMATTYRLIDGPVLVSFPFLEDKVSLASFFAHLSHLRSFFSSEDECKDTHVSDIVSIKAYNHIFFINRGEGLFVVGHLSGGAGNPSELIPSGRHNTAPHRTRNISFWLCGGV